MFFAEVEEKMLKSLNDSAGRKQEKCYRSVAGDRIKVSIICLLPTLRIQSFFSLITKTQVHSAVKC
jgi:hypothetical protein